MKPAPSTTVSQREAQVLNIQLLDLIDEMREEDVAEFRRAVKPEYRSVFERQSESVKQVYAALYRLGYKRLLEIKRAKDGKYLLGAHDIRNHLSFVLNGVLWDRD